MLQKVWQILTLSRGRAFCLLLFFSACDNPPAQNGPAESPVSTARSFTQDELSDAAVSALLDNYFRQANQDFDEALSSSQRLQQGIQQFLSLTNAENLDATRRLWLTAHEDYEGTALHRYFFQRVIDQSADRLDLDLDFNRLHFQINHWPILPGYIDYLAEYPDSGLISDLTLPLNRELLLQQHGAYDLAEALLGFHPLEFLLWSENTPDGVNLRSITDYQPVTVLSPEQLREGLQLVQLPNNRRRQLLELTGASLLEDLTALQQMWVQNENLMRSLIDGLGSTGAVTLLLDAVSDLLLEEILAKTLNPMLNGDFASALQSPYSHSTENAVIAQLASIENLLLTEVQDGMQFESMLAVLLPTFSDTFYQNFDASKISLTLLLASALAPNDPRETVRKEFEIVECINLISNMINTFELVKQTYR